jgi:hypothetical protein
MKLVFEYGKANKTVFVVTDNNFAKSICKMIEEVKGEIG